MSVFLILMIAGLFGLTLMALPGLNRHAGGVGGAGHGLLGHAGHGAAGHAATPHAVTGHTPAGTHGHDAPQIGGLTRFLPSPRAVMSVIALYGAFGYALTHTGWLSSPIAAFVALLPALVLERYAVTPFWNALLGFRGEPEKSLEALVMHEARAVTPFRNGNGIVEIVRDGRAVQFRATLPPAQATMPVRVGDCLRVEDVDAANERVTVSLH